MNIFRSIAYALALEFIRRYNVLQMVVFEAEELGVVDFRVKVTVERIGLARQWTRWKSASWTVTKSDPIEAN
jgi:hypothetical protein